MPYLADKEMKWKQEDGSYKDMLVGDEMPSDIEDHPQFRTLLRTKFIVFVSEAKASKAKTANAAKTVAPQVAAKAVEKAKPSHRKSA